jgi:hypothetical protein
MTPTVQNEHWAGGRYFSRGPASAGPLEIHMFADPSMSSTKKMVFGGAALLLLVAGVIVLVAR